MFCESGTEGRVCTEGRASKETKERVLQELPSTADGIEPRGSREWLRAFRRKLYTSHRLPRLLRHWLWPCRRLLPALPYDRSYASATFHELAHFVNKRVRHVIWRRKGRGGYGWRKVSSNYIYGHLGLFYDYHVARLSPTCALSFRKAV